MGEIILGEDHLPKKPYTKPEIILDIDLETRAGSPPGPLGPDINDDPTDITNPNF